MDDLYPFESSWIDISTTEWDDSELPINQFTILGLETVLPILVIFVAVKLYCQRKKQKNFSTWEELLDPDALRSPFKSPKSIKMSIEQQSVTTEMIVSNLFLVAAISINTYTNIRGYWHYRNGNLNMDDNASLLYGSSATLLLSSLELILTVTMMIVVMVFFVFRAYGDCITLTIHLLPNISAMVYFSFLNAELPKSMICDIWEKKKGTMVGRLCKTFGVMLMLLLMISAGVWVFVVKVNQITYIYQRNLSQLGLDDFILVVGVARQFATLYSMGKANGIDYATSTISPKNKKELNLEDPDWSKKYDINEVICQQIIREYCLFGFCWCCYIFSDVDNIKTLYLQEKSLESRAGSISMKDSTAPTAYIPINDKFSV